MVEPEMNGVVLRQPVKGIKPDKLIEWDQMAKIWANVKRRLSQVNVNPVYDAVYELLELVHRQLGQ
ncbi:hypothetical protein SBDP1_150004 [Syntrophobacter sp. SbD1]|nr:hypothetical protein SBDP1_150004 [Syntrophobacter sp. SbD1]